MESWSFGSEGKRLLFPEEMEIPIDAFARGRKGLLEWDNKACFNFDKESVQNMEFMELGFPDMVRKPFHANQGVEMLSGLVGNDSGSNLVASPPGWITSSSSLGEGESMSKFSSPVYEYTSHDSSPIALNLGMVAGGTDGQNIHQHSKENSKSGGTRGSNSHIPTCQVLGCNMDLSSSKDYHKRHRVCDAHSKTAKVIVNGMEQRFCQQCSRFHLLAEFDDAKRSCRGRLAGHNRRRRKAQLNTLNCRPRRLLRSCQGFAGTGNVGISFARRTPFVFSDILPGGTLYPEEYEQANQYGHVKYEDEPTYSPCVTPIANRQLVPMSFHHLHGLGTQHASGFPSSANEYSVFDSTATIQVTGTSKSSCALSLLSAQSHNLSSHSAGVQVPSPQMEPVLISDHSHAVDFDGAFQGSGCLSTKYCFSPQSGPTFDLLQLSSHLQRVEQEKTFLQVKQENGEC